MQLETFVTLDNNKLTVEEKKEWSISVVCSLIKLKRDGCAR